MLDPLSFRAANPQDFAFCRALYLSEAKWLIEKLGLDKIRHFESFAHQWVTAEVRVITIAGLDAGWFQIAPKDGAVFLKQLYLDRRFHNQGIGTTVMQSIIAEAAGGGHAVMLGVAKVNPARRLYERLGFHVTHEDEHKLYMRLDEPVREHSALAAMSVPSATPPQAGVSFDPVQVADADQLLCMARAFHAEEGHPITPAGEAAVVQIACGEPFAPAWIVRHAGRNVGYVVITLGFSIEYGGRDGFIDDLYLVPEARGRGLGEQLLAFALGQAERLGITTLHLEAEVGNERAISLYREAGFVETGRLLMRRFLRPSDRSEPAMPLDKSRG